jgi:hypothetical protein
MRRILRFKQNTRQLYGTFLCIIGMPVYSVRQQHQHTEAKQNANTKKKEKTRREREQRSGMRDTDVAQNVVSEISLQQLSKTLGRVVESVEFVEMVFARVAADLRESEQHMRWRVTM